MRAFGVDLAVRGAVVLGGLPRTVFPVAHADQAFDSLKRPGDVLQAALSY